MQNEIAVYLQHAVNISLFIIHWISSNSNYDYV